MNYLESYDNVVMQKCKVMQTSRNQQLKNIAEGRVTTSLDGGYTAINNTATPDSKKDLANIFKTKYQLNDKKFKQVIELIGMMDSPDEYELLYAELAELLGLDEDEDMEQVIQEVELITTNDAETQTDNNDGTDFPDEIITTNDAETQTNNNIGTDFPDWLVHAAQEILPESVFEVLPYNTTDMAQSPSSVNLVSPISQDSTPSPEPRINTQVSPPNQPRTPPSPELFSRESPRTSREPRINTQVSPPNQPRTPTQNEPTATTQNEPTARESRASARESRASARNARPAAKGKSTKRKSDKTAVNPKATPRIPKSLNVNTGSTSRNITGKEADEYMSYLDTLPSYEVNK